MKEDKAAFNTRGLTPLDLQDQGHHLQAMRKDARPIYSLFSADADATDEPEYRIGAHGITNIIPYLEDGDVLWFAIFSGTQIEWRVPGYKFSVCYDCLSKDELL